MNQKGNTSNSAPHHIHFLCSFGDGLKTLNGQLTYISSKSIAPFMGERPDKNLSINEVERDHMGIVIDSHDIILGTALHGNISLSSL